MAHHESRSKGKDIDRSSPWSEYFWHDNGYWVSSRYDETGALEYSYRYPESTQASQDPLAVPRSPGPNTFAQTSSHTAQYSPTLPNSSSPYTASTSPSYTITPVSQSGYSASVPPAYDLYHPAAGSHSSTAANYAQEPINTPASQHSTNAYSVEETTRSFQTLNVSSSPTATTSGYPPPTANQSHGNATVQAPVNELDPRYKVVDSKNEARFWRVGRVFLVLWTEPARDAAGGQLNSPGIMSRASSQFFITYLGTPAFTEIRRFVVVQEGRGNSICCPIHTYQGQATLKDNLADAQEHAIIYTSDKPPDEYWYEATDGSIVHENLEKDPIKVKSDNKHKESHLEHTSRINYAKIYTVEHYNRVLNIGMVEKAWIQTLQENSHLQRKTSIKKGVKHPPRARADHKKDDKGGPSHSKGNSSKGRHSKGGG